MMKLSYALVGLVVGLVPAALLVLSDRSVGHGSETISLLLLFILGIPGMTIGCFVGAFWQHRNRTWLHILLPLGGCLGGAAGLFGAMVIREILTVPLPEKESMCLGILAGGIIGVFIAGLFGGWAGTKDTTQESAGRND